MINSRFLALSLIAFSASSLANTLTFEEGTIIVPNDSVSSFEVTDLDNNGVKDLVYTTTAGELKFAKQTSGTPGPLPGKYMAITKESAERYLLNSAWVTGNQTYILSSNTEGRTTIKYLINGSGSGSSHKYTIFANAIHFTGSHDITMTDLTGDTVKIDGNVFRRK